MQFIQRNARFILPVAFFGYAAVVNLGFARFPGVKDMALDATILTGALTTELDSVYRQSLPHREPAIGAIGALRYLAVGEGRKGVVTGTAGWLYTAEELRPLAEPLDRPLARVAAIRDRLAAAGVTLVLVPVPGKLDVYADHATPEEALGIAAIYDGFLAGLARENIPAVDARAALRSAAAKGPVFFRTDTHWTSQGAKAVAEGLAGSGLVAPGSKSFTQKVEPERAFTGDLVSFVTSGAFAVFLGFSPEKATPYKAVDSEVGTGDLNIFGGAAAGGTVLIGTSYSANPTWSFAEALTIALGTDVLNHAAEGQGPVRPMLSYLGSEDFRTAPPALVIWEFPVRYLSDPAIWEPNGKEGVKSGA